MTVEEFDIALTDLETRVDRLRALYENWFRGYEKSEPHVPRKDVERRVYALRKELPRNTALRFRYHQLYLKYTTMANYWQRTARQIEEGTYKPQLMRLKRKLDREQELEERRERRRHERLEEKQDGPRGFELDLDESLDVDDLLDELELADVARAIEVRGPHSEPPPTTVHQRPPAAGKAPATASFARAKDNAPAKPAAPVPQPAVESTARGAALPNASFQNAPAPHAPGRSAPFPNAPAPNAPFPNVPGRAAPQPLSGAAGATLPGRPVPVPPGSAPQPAAARAPAPQVSLPGSKPGLSAFASAQGSKPEPSLPAARGPANPLAGPVQRSAPGTVPVAPTAGRPGVPQPALPAAAPARPATTAVGRPPPPSANTAPRPGALGPQSGGTYVGRPPVASPLANGAGAPTEQRLRHLYDEYTAARRRNNEGEVRYETLVSSIQKMLPELNKKHQGKQIDFDVVVKDGRVGLKPKAT